jgi:pimeloyl-ACP methyl ester carboxylesterase
MRYLYLHGFASGPQSLKARRFKAALSSRGFDLAIPDLARGDFEHLTISGQLDLLAENLAGEPARLVGSSMGAYVAALYASAHPEIDRLVLLAPAFEFSTRWRVIAGPEKLSHWGESG